MASPESIDSAKCEVVDASGTDLEDQQLSANGEKTSAPHRTVTAQDWNGPLDPENPWNWPTWQKVYT